MFLQSLHLYKCFKGKIGERDFSSNNGRIYDSEHFINNSLPSKNYKHLCLNLQRKLEIWHKSIRISDLLNDNPCRDTLYICKWYPPIVRVTSTPTGLVQNNVSHCLYRNNSTQESTSSFFSLLLIASLCKENVYVAVSKCFTLTKSELWKKIMRIYFNWENE